MSILITKPFFQKQPVCTETRTPLVTVCRPHFFFNEEKETEMLCRTFFGRTLFAREFAALCGGNNGEIDTTVGIDQSGIYLEYYHHQLDCIGACLIYQANDSRFVLSNEHVRFLHPADREQKKRRWFSQQKAACQSLGIATIQINAAKTSISQGYYYYPLLGFNAVLPECVSGLLPKKLTACRTLAELYAHPQGKQLWYQLGQPCQMTLELQENSTR